MHPGPIKFKSAGAGTSTIIEMNDVSPSKIAAAVTAAAATLSTTAGDIVIGDIHRNLSTMGTENGRFRGTESANV